MVSKSYRNLTLLTIFDGFVFFQRRFPHFEKFYFREIKKILLDLSQLIEICRYVAHYTLIRSIVINVYGTIISYLANAGIIPFQFRSLRLDIYKPYAHFQLQHTINVT